MKFLSAVDKVQRTIEKIACGIAAGIILVMVFPASLDVILRYLFHAPIPQVYDFSEFMIVGAVYLAVAYVQAIKGHEKIEAATSWLPEKGKAALDIFGYLIGVVLFAVITWQSSRLAWEAWITHDHTMGIIHIPTWPAKSMVPIGSGLLCLRLISDVFVDFAKYRKIIPGDNTLMEE